MIIIGLLLILIDASPVILVCLAVLVLVGALHITVRALARQTEIERGELRLRPLLRTTARSSSSTSRRPSGQLPGRHVAAVLPPDRPPVHHRYPDGSDVDQIGELCDELDVKVPLIHRKTLRSIEEIIVDSMTTAFYVNNAARNTHLVERRELTHVWLNHGDSEKPACSTRCTHL